MDGVWVVDDYAHHPTEIMATLKAARQTHPERLIVVFQPHRYTRTQLLLDEFAVAFKDADRLIVTDIYAASEDPIPGVTGKMLADKVRTTTGQEVEYMADQPTILDHLEHEAQSGDLIMTIGAGGHLQTGRTSGTGTGTEELTMDKKDRVAVVMGGPSKEREVSLNTGNAILNALKEKGYDAVAIDLDPEHIVDQLKASGAKVVFNAVHGLYGEDGRLQGILEMLGSLYGSAEYWPAPMAMDKV